MRGTVLILLTAASLAATAQHLPPVFAGKSAKTDSLTRAYITPERVVWAHGGVKQQDILLREGTGQPDMAGMPACTLQNDAGDTTSIILDYGRELHGGLKLVLGGANAASSRVRIRFGESVGECCAESDGGKNRKGFASNDHATRIDEMVTEGKVDVHRDYGAYCYLSYRHSLCHGWASGPTAWLSRHVLGVEVVDAGCRTLRIRPHLGSLLWAEGSWPTPFGPVSIRHEKHADGSISSNINAPAGVKIIKTEKP